eukprot:CAMPEP_0170646436 /NCGR_PEP_ID=MMETSP0224-20130122/43636_1 /TAXON_ID=285029 /ORGANISM="Togula jolla, Strain CCCM 725" /LENGTH=181 /DNA_ID=CAMNT_0010977767 /DNA_START=44 /DNA_END=585 /DNA_ORIENTATION=+
MTAAMSSGLGPARPTLSAAIRQRSREDNPSAYAYQNRKLTQSFTAFEEAVGSGPAGRGALEQTFAYQPEADLDAARRLADAGDVTCASELTAFETWETNKENGCGSQHSPIGRRRAGQVGHVWFNSPVNTQIEITPYSQVYGVHPRFFHFDDSGQMQMIPSAPRVGSMQSTPKAAGLAISP